MKAGAYPEGLVLDEGKVGDGRLFLTPLPRNASTAKELAVSKSGAQFEGHVRLWVLGTLVTHRTTSQAHIKARTGDRHIQHSQINMTSALTKQQYICYWDKSQVHAQRLCSQRRLSVERGYAKSCKKKNIIFDDRLYLHKQLL